MRYYKISCCPFPHISVHHQPQILSVSSSIESKSLDRSCLIQFWVYFLSLVQLGALFYLPFVSMTIASIWNLPGYLTRRKIKHHQLPRATISASDDKRNNRYTPVRQEKSLSIKKSAQQRYSGNGHISGNGHQPCVSVTTTFNPVRTSYHKAKRLTSKRAEIIFPMRRCRKGRNRFHHDWQPGRPRGPEQPGHDQLSNM